MKILMLCEFYSPAVEFQENLLVKYYRKHGHEVTVVTSTFESIFDYYGDRYDKRRTRSEFLDHGARIIRLPYRYNFFNRLRAYTRIDAILEECRPDLIFVHDIMPNLPEAIRYKKAHPECRMILDYHADYSNSGRNALSLRVLHGFVRKRFLDQARPHLSRIFPIVPAGATFLHEIYRVPYTEMEVLPLGADMDLIRVVAAEGVRSGLRRRLGVSETDVLIFTGGKMTPTRQTEILFNALKRLGRHDIKVVVIGDCDEQELYYKNQLQNLAEGRDDIRFAGWLDREDVYRHMAAADLAVFPARQSILWQQCIAMGLPLVVGDTGWQDISYLNLHDNIVILRREDINDEKLADVIGALASDPVRLARMAVGARRVADEQLDWNRMIERTLRFNTRSMSGVDQ